jgi:hypothetical protein
MGGRLQAQFLLFPVEPGEHHVCVSAQPQSYEQELVALAHFTAERGKVYYFRTQFLAGTTTLYPTPPHRSWVCKWTTIPACVTSWCTPEFFIPARC